MVAISFAVGMELTVLGFIMFRGLVWRRRKTYSWKEELLQLLMLINLLVIVRFVFYPFETVNGQIQPLLFEPEAIWPPWINLVPLVNLLDYETERELVLNLVGNFLMFVPSGILFPSLYPKLRSFGRTALAGFLMSLSIELLQLPFAVRASDVDDLILNSLGVVLGYGIHALVNAMVRLCRKREKGIKK